MILIGELQQSGNRDIGWPESKDRHEWRGFEGRLHPVEARFDVFGGSFKADFLEWSGLSLLES